MTQPTYPLRGTLAPEDRTCGGLRPLFSLRPGAARDGNGETRQVPADTVVRVELDNGFVLWSRMDDLARDFGRQASRDGSAWELTRLTPRRQAAGERGAAGLVVKVLDFFGIDLAEKSAAKLGAVLERKLLGHEPGLYRLPLGAPLAFKPVADGAHLPANAGPILLFLHGTASSGEGSFGKLWQGPAADAVRRQLLARYGERCLAFEHRTLTHSPIENALALVRQLPQGAELHLVSHSRGGLVGELLCLSGCTSLAATLTPDNVAQLFAADRTLAPQLGLLPLADDEAIARDAAYAADRDRLLELVAELGRKQLRVTRFARVACPARGTTLASGRLDRWLSVLDYLAQGIGGGLIGDGVEFLHAVVKERTDPRTLPGVEAMMPGSALTRLLNATPELATSADLSVIAGDIEPGDGVWNTLKVLASDWFYKNEHDLVVDTASMSGGLPRPAGARQRQDKGPRVNHFRYFTNEQSLGWLQAALLRADGDNAGFQPIAATGIAARARTLSAARQSRSDNKPRPIVVVLPGTMGSELHAGDDAVWLDYWSLLRGGLKKIAMGRDDIRPVGLVDDFYGPLVEFLARSHQVELFPYDWRQSVRQAALRLAERLEPLVAQAERNKQPLRIVAHSMGGLVVRSLIGDGAAGSALWRRITRLPGSRFLMLGTPNLGSYEAVRWLTGFNPTQAKLSLLDLTHNTDEIINLVARFPGLLELLPFAPDDPDFADASRWNALRKAIGGRWNPAQASDLGTAAATWRFLKNAAPDPDFMCYVAGCQPATVIDYQLVPGDLPYRPDLQRIEFIASREGDGTVPWDSGRLPGVPMWYVADTAHDMLCAQPKAFPGYLDILVGGRTSRLPSTPPARARGETAETFVLPALPPADSMPDEATIRRLGFCGEAEFSAEMEIAIPRLAVSITHGSLGYARHPVLVGHYQGDTVVSAEAVLDRQLDGQLTRRFDLGLYPGPLGSHAIFLNASALARPMGAIVTGLGKIGELRPSQLEASLQGALLDYALSVAQWPDDRFGPPGQPRSAAVSCLLVGSGDGGVPVGDAIRALLNAAVAANQALAREAMNDKVIIDRLEVVELYEDVALIAADALRQALADERLAARIDWPAGAVEEGQAGHRRVRLGRGNDWYQRLEIRREASTNGAHLRFVFPTDKARAEETTATGQLALADEFVRIASSDTRQNAEAARTLFEMLLPLRLREMAPQQGNTVVLVDAESACYPWELLENRWSGDSKPPAVRAGMVRQFITQQFRPRPLQTPELTALVIGDPDLQANPAFDQLPGALDEATQVAELLASRGYDVTDCLGQPALPILENLHKNGWRILHLAGHGVHRYQTGDGRCVSGMVIGQNSFLTPGDIEQMRIVPDLVFINCCHLGRMDGPPLDRLGLAANLGQQFIDMGVRAVIAAGWAVEDQAGAAFASSFYGAMLAGQPFGEAVRTARAETWQRFEGCNTWGAYQCYGDPDFRFFRSDNGTSRPPLPYGALPEIVADLDNLAADLRAGWDGAADERIKGLLARIPERCQADWLAQPALQTALGLAWGEAGAWEEANARLKEALAGEKGCIPLRALEQYANFRIRLAAQRWQQATGRPAAREKSRREQVALIETAIYDLDTLCRCAATAERLSLLGGAYKRLALIEDAPARRTEALVNMAHHYRLAFGRNGHPYPFCNWVIGHLLATGIDPVAAAVDSTPTAAELERLIGQLNSRLDHEPNFWDSAALADLQLVRLLWQAALPPRQRRLAVASGPVIDAYQRALARGASPRERATLAAHNAFLKALWPAADSASHEVLRAIEESLS